MGPDSAFLDVAWIDTFRKLRTDISFHSIIWAESKECREKYELDADQRYIGYFSTKLA